MLKEEQIQAIWEKGRQVPGYDKDKIRQDDCGAWILRDKYGDTSSIYGWVVDHIYPAKLLKSIGDQQESIDNLANMRPLNWLNNAAKGVDFPIYKGQVRARGNKNSLEESTYEVSSKTKAALKAIYPKIHITL